MISSVDRYISVLAFALSATVALCCLCSAFFALGNVDGVIEFHQRDAPHWYALGLVAPRLMARVPQCLLESTGVHPYGLPYLDFDRYLRSVTDSFDELRSDVQLQPYDPNSTSIRDSSLRVMVYESAALMLLIAMAISVYPVTKACDKWTEKRQKIE